MLVTRGGKPEEIHSALKTIPYGKGIDSPPGYYNSLVRALLGLRVGIHAYAATVIEQVRPCMIMWDTILYMRTYITKG